jgi:putative DNA primase/helicase
VKILEEINHAGLEAVREQLFAEAYQAWLSGDRYWPTREEQKAIFDPVQLASSMQESFIDILSDWVSSQLQDFSLAYAAKEGLGIDASKLTRDIQTRVGHALSVLGCTRVERRTLAVRYWYRPPVKSTNTPAQPERDDDEIIPF